MRCMGCNRELTDFEATRRYSDLEEFIDLCNDCFRCTEIKAIERPDLVTIHDVVDLEGNT